MDKKHLGENIKNLRKRKGKTQKEMGDDLGISRSALGMIETGKRDTSLDFLVKIANYFKVSTDYLLGNTGKDTDSTTNSMMKNLIDVGKIKESEILTEEKRRKLMKIIKTAIELSNM